MPNSRTAVDEREQPAASGAFDSLREQQHHQSVAIERQRIMREIHDGVGSQLVGLLNMVTRNAAPTCRRSKEHVQLALDEMRMAVDSLQPAHDDLATVLATLRYRLQSRLEAAGIEVIWEVAELPELRELLAPSCCTCSGSCWRPSPTSRNMRACLAGGGAGPLAR